jgi:hypothetical protein
MGNINMKSPQLMRSSISLFIAIYTITFIYPHPTCYALEAHNHEEEQQAGLASDARPQIVKILSNGVVPANFTMQRSDSVVFFYNTTNEDLLTLEIDFGSSSVHCSGALRVVKEPGLSRTRKPFGPKEFVSTCFHEKGAYPYKIFSSLDKNRTFTGTVTVE